MTHTCTTEKLVVETEKGTYTITHGSYAVETCEAEKKCTQAGSVLAPFKSRYCVASLPVNLAVE